MQIDVDTVARTDTHMELNGRLELLLYFKTEEKCYLPITQTLLCQAFNSFYCEVSRAHYHITY